MLQSVDRKETIVSHRSADEHRRSWQSQADRTTTTTHQNNEQKRRTERRTQRRGRKNEPNSDTGARTASTLPFAVSVRLYRLAVSVRPLGSPFRFALSVRSSPAPSI